MDRNLNRRVESLVKIVRSEHKKALISILDQYLASTTAAWHLLSSGKWQRVDKDPSGKPLADLQAVIINSYRANG
jgi:polyphosphate kinase